MHTNYGRFSPDGQEYIITDPRTPRPWHNYLFNSTYLVNLTQHGTGSSFWQPRGEGLRVNVTEDRDGSGGPRYVYLRDNDTGEFWSLTGMPIGPEFEQWECRIGPGYQIMTSRHRGIEASWRVFVPNSADRIEIWTLTIRNTSGCPRNISLFPYVEMHLTGGSTLMDFIAVLGGYYDERYHAIMGINNCVKFPPAFKAFLASDRRPDASTVSRDSFIGHYRNYNNPIAVETGTVNNIEAGTEWLGASLRHDLTFGPGESLSINCFLGVMEKEDECREVIDRMCCERAVESAFNELQNHSRDNKMHNFVKTPDARFDRWINIWLKHQLRFVERWGRVIGRGFRDILQDTFGHRLVDPIAARHCILEVCSKQFPDGRGIRAWRLPTGELDLQDYADSPSWLIMALSYYLKETADFKILDENVSFLNEQDPYAPSDKSGTVWEHLLRAQLHLLGDRGEHGLSLIHYGDWCDTMNGVGAAGKGESVMLSMQVKWGCDLLAALARQTGKEEIASRMETESKDLAEAINENAWDGGWYLRAFDDNGKPVGTQSPPSEDRGEGLIFLNPQSWSVISGTASPERQASALAAALERLDVGYGMVLNAPAYTQLIPRIGQMTAMTPGFYENGSVYVHGNCFWIHALAYNGMAEEAWRAFNAILPDESNKPECDTEPFVIPNYYIGPVVKRRRQKNLYLSGWRTGSAAWLYMTAIEEILGVRAEYEGLSICPSLPDGWEEAEVNRYFRKDVYLIQYDRPGGKGNTVKALFIDGTPLEGTIVPYSGDGKKHHVRVELSE